MAAFPMRTGFDLVQEPGLELNDDQKTVIMSLLVILSKKALEDAAIYTKEAGRNVISARDIILGLKKHALPSGGFWDDNTLDEKVREEFAALKEEMEIEEDVTTEIEDEATEGEEDTEEEWTEATTDHPIVLAMNAVQDQWNAWTPDDKMSIVIKKSVEKSERIFC